MVTKKAPGKRPSVSKLKFKKETIKDLNVKGKAGNVKGGNKMMTVTCRPTCACPQTALKPTIICG